GGAHLTYCLAAGLLLSPAVRAEGQDPAKLTPFVEETLTTDDNVFRISKDVDPATVIGSSSRADTYHTTAFGLNAEMPLSLQRFERGKFPTAEPFTTPLSTMSIDNAYRQYAAGLTLDWTVTGISHLVARADQVSRRYDQLPQRNFTGQTGRIELTWTPTGKTTLTAIVQRDISPYEFTRSSLVLLKGLGLRPRWHVTPKIDLPDDLEALTRRYVADPAQAPGLTGQRDDQVRSVSALISYHPTLRIGVQATLL